jgi:hypothetical protein
VLLHDDSGPHSAEIFQRLWFEIQEYHPYFPGCALMAIIWLAAVNLALYMWCTAQLKTFSFPDAVHKTM